MREIGLKWLNRYVEKLNEIIEALEGNLRVWKAVLKFYRSELLQDRQLKARNLEWMTDKASRARIRNSLDEFEEEMRWVCTSTLETRRRVVALKQATERREGSARLFLSLFLARVTYRDSTTMKVFSSITLVLLPASVVSTIFSAGIVDFQSGNGGFAGSWSGPAAFWWALVTVLVTLLVGWAAERWRRPVMDAAGAGKRREFKRGSWTTLAWTITVRQARHYVEFFTYVLRHKFRPGYARAVRFFKRPTVPPLAPSLGANVV